jgi:hypothetical protein
MAKDGAAMHVQYIQPEQGQTDQSRKLRGARIEQERLELQARSIAVQCERLDLQLEKSIAAAIEQVKRLVDLRTTKQ